MHTETILLFDGHCNLCSGLVQFILRHDRQGRIKMASLQSEVAKGLLKKHNLGDALPDSMLLIGSGRYWVESDAALQLARELGGWWMVFGLFRIFPRFVRDAAYRLVARNRYRIWGKSVHCYMPRPEWKDRFLHDQ
jgi:predicted DCC family thiol-disulfide oxidoreductase YuxK